MRILLSVPNTGWVHKLVIFRVISLLKDPRYNLQLILPTHRPYENNLHHIVRDVIQGEFDFWLNIDSDNPPMRNPLDVVAEDKDIVGFPTPVWHYNGDKKERPVYWNGYDSFEGSYKEHLPRDGLQRVDAIGTGCFLMAGRVFDNLNMRQAPFERQHNKDGTVHKGNDLSFCEKAKCQGFEVWCHYGYPCRHVNELELLEVVQAFKGLYE